MQRLFFVIIASTLLISACKTTTQSETAEALSEKRKIHTGIFQISYEGDTATMQFELKMGKLRTAYLNTQILENEIGPAVTPDRNVILKLQNAILPTYSNGDISFTLSRDANKVDKIVYSGLYAKIIESKTKEQNTDEQQK